MHCYDGQLCLFDCLAIAVNAIAGAVFASYGEQEQKDRMKDFIIVSTYQLNISKMI